METYECFFADDYGSDNAAWEAASWRYLTRAKHTGTAVVAAVVSRTFGEGYEVWATTERHPSTTVSMRVRGDGQYVPLLECPPIMEVIPWIAGPEEE